jgi:hypothetical protein
MPFSIRPSRRFPVCCPVTYQCGLFEGHGTVWNLSCTGWRLSGDLPMRPAEPLSLIVTLPNEQRIEIPEGTAIPLRSTSFRSFPPMPQCATLFSERAFTG